MTSPSDSEIKRVARAARLAEQLRANLRRRKGQARELRQDSDRQED